MQLIDSNLHNINKNIMIVIIVNINIEILFLDSSEGSTI